MVFNYTIDPLADEPIMLLNKQIGDSLDEDGQYIVGINGSYFQSELMALDAMGKKSIQVWINSPGGSVMEGYNIYDAILKSKTKVDTRCYGLAASIAAVIFQAGRKRTMTDGSHLMYHNAFGGDDKDGLDKINQSIATMVAGRSGKSKEEILKMMAKTTWINASEATANGLCDTVEFGAELNKKRLSADQADIKAFWNESNKIVNNLFQNNNRQNMTTLPKVTMRLKLNDAAREDDIVTAIDAIENKAITAEAKVSELQNKLSEAENKVTDIENKAKSEKEKNKEAMDKAKAEYDDLKAKYDAMEEDKKNAEAETKKVEAKNMVEGFAKQGRIKNDATTILKWTNMAIKDGVEEVKAIIEDLPLNKAAVAIPVENKVGDGEMATTSMSLAAQVQNNLKKQGRNI